jgi:hypothetical protein
MNWLLSLLGKHVCYDDRNERCEPDHCTVIGCPAREKTSRMRKPDVP